jgi:hypothetical protein
MKRSTSGLLTSSRRRGVTSDSATSGKLRAKSPIRGHSQDEAKPGGQLTTSDPVTPRAALRIAAPVIVASARRTSAA